MPRIQITRTVLACLLTSMLLSCGNFLKPHKISIQQGNIISISLVDKLEPGMSKRQVEYILGTPLIVDSLNTNQWVYLFSLEDGRTGQRLDSHIKLSFKDQLLTDINTDLPRPTAVSTPPNSPAQQIATIEGEKLEKKLPTEQEDSRNEAGL